MFNNPLITRYKVSSMRPQQLFIFLTIYTVTLGLLGMINASIYKNTEMFMSLTFLYKSLYVQFLCLQMLLLWVWSTINSGSVIRDEILGHSYDFFKLLPLSAFTKATGILIGKNVLVIMLVIINFGIMITIGILAKLDVLMQIQLFAALACTTFFINNLSLLVSFNPIKNRKNSIVPFIILMMFFGVPLMINLATLLYKNSLVYMLKIPFYTTNIPVMIVVSLISVYFGCWAFKGILRKFNYETEPLFTTSGAVVFFVGFECILLGFFYKHFGQSTEEIHYLFMLLTAGIIAAIPLFALKDFNSYIEQFSMSKSGSSNFARLGITVRSNLFTCFVLALVWFVFGLISAILNESEIVFTVKVLGTILTFYIFIVLLYELYAVYKSTVNKIAFLIVFIGILYAVLPPVLAGIFDYEQLMYYSPTGFFALIFDREPVNSSMLLQISAVNLALSIIPIILVAGKYRFVMQSKKLMHN